MRNYMQQRYVQRMSMAKEYLGGKCIRCGSKNELELDHIDPKTKILSIAEMWNKPLEVFWVEVRKCQLLCAPCHISKTKSDLGQPQEPLHGTITRAKNYHCKCEACRQVSHEYWVRWKAKQGLLAQSVRASDS